MRLIRSALGLALLAGFVVGIAPGAGASPATYRVQVDTFPPREEPWEFTKFFPSGGLTLHTGDLVDANFSGFGFHTATFIPAAHPNAWRSVFQAPGAAFAVEESDAEIGGDDNELIFNPTAVADRHRCGKSADNPCAFYGNTPLNAGGHGNGQSFFVRIAADPGHYSLICLLHAHMQIPLTVVAAGAGAPSPAAVAAQVKKDVVHALRVDGPAADRQAQAVHKRLLADGTHRVTIHAGGSSNGASAIEYNDEGFSLHVGDQLRVMGTNEIHTATFPRSSFKSVQGFVVACEQPGPDPLFVHDCPPSRLEFRLSDPLVDPTSLRALRDPDAFVNSGLLNGSSKVLGLLNGRLQATFVAKVPGTYTMICLIHGPIMSTTVTVKP